MTHGLGIATRDPYGDLDFSTYLNHCTHTFAQTNSTETGTLSSTLKPIAKHHTRSQLQPTDEQFVSLITSTPLIASVGHFAYAKSLPQHRALTPSITKKYVWQTQRVCVQQRYVPIS